MRKIILLGVLIFGMNMYSQEAYISGLFDGRNTVLGSEATNNKSAFDGLFKCTMVGKKGFKADVKYETFKKIGFKRYSVGVGYVIEKDFYLFGEDRTFTIAPTLGTSLIKRDWDYYRESFIINPEISIPVRYKFSDKWGAEIHPELLFRGDSNERYGNRKVYTKDDVKFSLFFGITYKISK